MINMLPSLRKLRKEVTIFNLKSTNGIESSTILIIMLILSIPIINNYINYSAPPSNMPEEDKISLLILTDTPILLLNASIQAKY